jgi:hypothetical protein
MYVLKTQQNDTDVADFLNEITDEQRRDDCLTLVELFTEITGEKPKMWGQEIVGFGAYHYKGKSGHEGDWFITGFSPRKQNLTIYISAGFQKYDEIMQDLGKYKTGSSCLYVKKLSDIHPEKFRELVRRSHFDMQKV